MKISMFPGQGSQSKGMGGALFDHFQELTAQADAILGYSIKALCLDDPRGELGNTQFTQPALYVVNALSYLKKLEDGGERPDFLMGHSLGEFNALLAAGVFDFETGLKLVRRRGELMAQATSGGMAAVMNATKEQIEAILQANDLKNVYLANYNTPSQIVLSGLVDELAKAEPFFNTGKTRFYPLATSGAFHSAFMNDAMVQFKDFLKDVDFAAPKVPVIANVTARPYDDGAILETLSSQIASTVQWCDSVRYLLALGASRNEAVQFEELGQGDVLTKLVLTVKAQTPDDVLQALRSQLPAAAAPDRAALRRQGVQTQVSSWNRTHPVGTKVKSLVAQYDALETRTEAMVLFGHRAAVYMQGYEGYFDLDELAPA